MRWCIIEIIKNLFSIFTVVALVITQPKETLFDNCIFISALFRKSDWAAVGGFCQEFLYGMEDYDFWLSIIGLGRTVVQMPETYFFYRIKPSSRTTQFLGNIEHTQETYVLLYQRHKALIAANMDLFCLRMRRYQIESIQTIRSYESSFVVKCWLRFRSKKLRIGDVRRYLALTTHRVRNALARSMKRK